MTELTDVLELMHTARRRYRTVEARAKRRGTARETARQDQEIIRISGRPDQLISLEYDGTDTHVRQCMFEPNVIIPELWLEPGDEVTVAGRRGILVRGRPRPTTHDYFVLPVITEDYELVVDAKRGILLRLDCIDNGRVEFGVEIVEIQFDGEG